jgi:urate oxidase
MARFCEGYSKVLQQTLYPMAGPVIGEHEMVDEIESSCPNKHHFLSDLSFCGLDNPNWFLRRGSAPTG